MRNNIYFLVAISVFSDRINSSFVYLLLWKVVSNVNNSGDIPTAYF